VAYVAGVLLDHVQVDQPQRHLLATETERVVQGVVGDGGVGQLELLGQPGVVRGGAGRVDAGELGLAVRAERALHGLAGEPDPEPAALDLRQVPDQAEQGQAGRWHGTLGELLAGQARALP
jgi:hypothetical protein